MQTTIDVEKFPLTYKWKGLIGKLSYQNKFSYQDAVQDALILEWQTSQKIVDLKHRENYFKKVLYRNLYSIGKSYWDNHKIDLSFCNDEAEDEMPLDQIVITKSFDKIFFEELISHISYLLLAIDFQASSIFLMRVREELKWKEIKVKRYDEMPHNQFYDRVSLIKSTTQKEIMIDKSLRMESDMSNNDLVPQGRKALRSNIPFVTGRRIL